MKQEQVIELAEKHGATSYRNRADTENPAYGFTGAQLEALISEVEQATLERAAQRVETYCIELCHGDKDMQKHYLRSKSTREFYAGAVRNLAKDTQ